MRSPSQIIIFKTPASSSEDGNSDPYQDALIPNSYIPSFVSVLSETYRLGELNEIIQSGLGSKDQAKANERGLGDGGLDEGRGAMEGDRTRWEGVIVSSKRGAEGWMQAVENIRRSIYTHLDGHGLWLINEM